MEECLTKVSSHDVKIVRVGRLAEGASEELKKCLLREVYGLICYAFAPFSLEYHVNANTAVFTSYSYLKSKDTYGPMRARIVSQLFFKTG